MINTNPRVSRIEPNPELSRVSELPSGFIPEMMLLHEENSHYNLIIPRDSKLALEGGFDFQREQLNRKSSVGKQKSQEEGEKKAHKEGKEEVNKEEANTDEEASKKEEIGKEEESINMEEVVIEEEEMNQEENLLNEKEGFEERIIELENKCNQRIVALEKKCESLETEKKELISKMEIIRGSKKDIDKENEDERVLFNYKNSGHNKVNPQTYHESKSKKLEFACKECDCRLESAGLLTAHMKSHKEKYQCEHCDTVFWTNLHLENHVKYNHEKFEVRDK